MVVVPPLQHALLKPLMRGATIDSVLHVAQRVLDETEAEAQGDLLAMRSAFSQWFIEPKTFIELVGKERLMTYGAITILAHYKSDAILHAALRTPVEEALGVRFPTLPFVVARRPQQVPKPAALTKLHAALLTAPDKAATRVLITQAADAAAV